MPLSALLLFWSLSVFNLDRYPTIHEDEPWILSPGYKLFTQGVYGSDLFSGFFHIERIYLKIGASSRSTATLFAMQQGMLSTLEPVER